MLVFEQRLSARHRQHGVRLKARMLHRVDARGWRMRFILLRTDVEIETRDPAVYDILARRLTAANIHVRPARTCSEIVTPKSVVSPLVVAKPELPQAALLPPANQMKQLYCQEGGELKANTPPCHSPGSILPDLPQSTEDQDTHFGLSKDATAAETQEWLKQHRFNQHAATFSNFSGSDLLRLSRDDIIEICGLADGIRLYNALHAKRIEPRLTLYVCPAGSLIYSALYLHTCSAQELLHKLKELFTGSLSAKDYETVLVSGPNDTRVRLTDELVRHLPDNSTYRVKRLEENYALLLTTSND